MTRPPRALDQIQPICYSARPVNATAQKHVYIRTFGCQMNEHDSDKIRLMLKGLGYDPTEVPEEADLILFNTCTIREKAHHKAMSEIGRAKVYKKGRSGVIVGVCGCVAQEEKGSIFERYPHVDILFGPDQIAALPKLIDEAKGHGRASALDLIDDPSKYVFLNGLPVTSHQSPITSHQSRVTGHGSRVTGHGSRVTGYGSRISAFVSIMKGCNCACSYCIVPSVRGREVCRPADEIIDEVKRLASSGTKEVVLLGQNVNAYTFHGLRVTGYESRITGHETISFANLLGKIAKETSIERIRFISPHPRDVDDGLIREYAENEKLMPHIHLPVQAGSNAVLKKMRRGYTRERYIEICDRLYAARPGMSITTDLIVGFCGETAADYEETLDLMRRVEFDSAFAFKYSPRPGTEAADKFSDDVPQDEKGRRLENLLSLQRETSMRKNQALLGFASEALATEMDKMDRGLVTGRLPDNRIVHFAGKRELIGNIVRVRVTKAHANSLAAEAIQ